MRLIYTKDSQNCAGNNVSTTRDSYMRQVKGQVPDDEWMAVQLPDYLAMSS
jgi:hypothetical protein